LKIDEIRALSSEELQRQLEESRQALFNLRFRHATKQLVNNREIPKTKKKIARILTILKEKELGTKSETE
jgi:large subunit ribosomal protein L29